MLKRLKTIAKSKTVDYNALFQNVLDHFKGEESMKYTLKALEYFGNSPEFNSLMSFKISAVLNQIFLKDKIGIYQEMYKDFLSSHQKETCYFEVSRLLRNDQYEMAYTLATSKYKEFTQNPILSSERLTKQLKFYELLFESAKRNDATVSLELLDVLDQNSLVSPSLCSVILGYAISNSNSRVCLKIFEILKDEALSDGCLYSLGIIFIKEELEDVVIDIIVKITSYDLKKKLSLLLISNIELFESFQVIERLSFGKKPVIEALEYTELPGKLLNIPNLKDYDNLKILLENLKLLKEEKSQKLYIYSLLSSIDKNQGHSGSLIFLLRWLIIHRMTDKLSQEHIDIMFHSMSHFGQKLTSLKMSKLLQEWGFKLSEQNYYYLMKTQCFGKEFDTLFVVAMDYLQNHGTFTSKITSFLEQIFHETGDRRLKLLLNKDLNVDKFNEIIDIKYLRKNLDDEYERNKKNHKIISGLGTYSYKMDKKSYRTLNMKH